MLINTSLFVFSLRVKINLVLFGNLIEIYPQFFYSFCIPFNS